MIRAASRHFSVTTAHLTSLFKVPTLVLATARHATSAIYFAAICATYKVANQKDLRSVQAFAPVVVGPIMGILALLHLYGLAWTVARVCRLHVRRRKSPSSATILASPLNAYLSQSTQLTVFHSIDVVCQSYQAGRMSYYLVDRRYAITFALLVSLYSLVTPWFLFAKHAVARRSLILLVNNCLGFILNSVIPLFLFFIQALKLVILDRKIQNDDKFVTVSLLIGRYLVVTSPTDLATKVVMQCLSCVSIRRLVQSVTRHPPRGGSAVTSAPSTILVAPSTQHGSFHLEFQRRRWLLWYLVLNLVWGSIVVACAVAATFFRTPCPDYCVFSTSPWFDLQCSCVHVEVNCALRGIPGETIDEFIQPSEIGTNLFTLNVRRCDLRHGVAIAALQPFQSLFGVFLYMTNITTWPADPTGLSWPPSLALLHVRGNNFRAVPDAFSVLPPHVVFFRIEGGNISVIPEEIFQAWSNVSSLSLSNLQLTRLPLSISSFHDLVSLELRGNLVTTVPWLAADVATVATLQTVDLSANSLEYVPMDLVLPKVKLELSSNPIAFIPAELNAQLLVDRQVILDDTPYCSATDASYCLSKCARQCETKLLGDHRCDEVCYSSVCNWDNGDCAAYGLPTTA